MLAMPLPSATYLTIQDRQTTFIVIKQHSFCNFAKLQKECCTTFYCAS